MSRTRSAEETTRARVGRGSLIAAVALLGVVASILLARNLQVRERQLFELELAQRADERVQMIERELRSALEHVESIAALYTSVGSVDRRRFRAFSSIVLGDHAAVRVVGFNPVVPHELREAHERQVRLEGFPEYRITERAPDGSLVAAAERDEYVVPIVLEPFEGNEAALGFDIASEPLRREALIRARDTGQAAMTGRLRLVQETGHQYGVLICIPIYSGPFPETVRERNERLRGYAVGVLRLGDLVNSALSGLRATGIHLRLEDASASPEQRLLHFHRSRTLPAAEAGERDSSETFESAVAYSLKFAGRQWQVQAEPTAAFRAARASWIPLGVLVAGLLSTASLVGYLFWQTSLNRQLRRANVEREQADERQAGFGRMLDESHDEIYVFDADSLRFVHANRGARKNLGYSMAELRNLTPADLKTDLTPESFAELLLPLREGTRPKIEFTATHRRKDGSIYDVEVHIELSAFDGAPAFVAVILDITERKQLEEKLHQRQRLESLGTLAGGIAHDFNNLLTAIMGYTELSLADIPEGTTLRDNLSEVSKASARARDVVQQILAFSRRSPMKRRSIDLAALGRETLQLMRASLPATIVIRDNLAEGCRCAGDPTQIHQVLMNLCTNSAHAMRENGGILEICLDSVELSASQAEPFPGLTAGRYSRFTVRDTGHGIPAEIVDRILDPFFTTKKPGEGTGMGLAVVHGIVTSHGGCLHVSSAPGRGTTCDVYLPRDASIEAGDEKDDKTLQRGVESILLVDDEPAIAGLFETVLRRSGYRVESFTDSAEALAALRSRKDSFDLVITDYTMPKMTGTALAREIARVAPQIPVILISGHGVQIDDEEIRNTGVSVVLTKPVGMPKLISTVRRALNESAIRCSTVTARSS